MLTTKAMGTTVGLEPLGRTLALEKVVSLSPIGMDNDQAWHDDCSFLSDLR